MWSIETTCAWKPRSFIWTNSSWIEAPISNDTKPLLCHYWVKLFCLFDQDSACFVDCRFSRATLYINESHNKSSCERRHGMLTRDNLATRFKWRIAHHTSNPCRNVCRRIASQIHSTVGTEVSFRPVATARTEPQGTPHSHRLHPIYMPTEVLFLVGW